MKKWLILVLSSMVLSAHAQTFYEQMWQIYMDEGIEYYNFSSNTDLALESFQSAFETANDIYTKKDYNLGITASWLAHLYTEREEYTKAIEMATLFIEVVEVSKGKQDNRYSDALSRLGSIYYTINDLENALSLYSQALDNTEQYLGKDHAHYGIYLNNVASVYSAMSQQEKSLPLFLVSLENTAQTLGKENTQYAICLSNIGECYKSFGDYKKALPYFTESLERTESLYGTSHMDYGICLNNLSMIYVLMGDYEKALPLSLEVLEISKTRYGVNHSEYAFYLSNMGHLYFKMERYYEAEKMYEEALGIIKKTVGTSHDQYLTILNGLAMTYQYIGDYKKALPYSLEVLELSEQILGTSHPDYGTYANNLACLYQFTGQYEKALPSLIAAVKNTEQSLGKTHVTYGKRLNNLALLHQGMGNYDEALPLFYQANDVLFGHMKEILGFRSENESKAFMKTLSFNFDMYSSVNFTLNQLSPDLLTMNLNNQLYLKGLLLNNHKNVVSDLRKLNDTILNENILSLEANEKMYAEQLSLSPVRRSKNIDSLFNLINAEESLLMGEYDKRFGQSAMLQKDWKNIQNALTDDEIAIEFAHFNYRSVTGWTDSTLYCAYLLKKGWSAPELVYLFEEQQLKDILSVKSPNALYSTRGGRSVSLKTVAHSDSIYKFVWAPLEPYLKDLKTVYYAPDGLLHQIPFAALGNKNEALISDQFNLVQLGSTDVICQKRSNLSLENTLLIGGITYDYDTTAKQKVTFNYSYLASNEMQNLRGNRSRSSEWNFLPGTKNEIENIEKVLTSRKKPNTMLVGPKAHEQAFKQLSGSSPSVLHIATHGFFFENKKSKPRGLDISAFTASEDPMLRSGLILSGANYAWKHGSNPYETEDGILTALEISHMDLTKTDVVVLSACETGLGDIEGSEGVYGLQRAFKMAGVDVIIMSLWEVPDAETAEFMSLLYTTWAKNKSLRHAFNQAQKEMRTTYSSEPLKWAAFVMLE